MAQIDTTVGCLPRSRTDAGVPVSPSKERFYKYFQQEVVAIQDQIDQLQHLGFVGGERQDAVDHCLAGISRLSNEVSDSTDFIPAYDQRTYAQAIRALTDKLSVTRAKVLPKPKFSFKPQKNSSAISLTDAAELAAAQQRLNLRSNVSSNVPSIESSLAATPAHLMTPPVDTDTVGELPHFSKQKDYNEEISRPAGSSSIRKPSFSQAASISLSNHKGLHIILPSSASRATSSGQVTKMSGCVVDMSVPTTNGAPFAGLSIKNIKNSLIIAGQVAGAAHITAVKDSILVVSSRQVRMHDCKNVDIYLMCASRPIIEDCEGVRFAPIPSLHNTTQGDLTNHWDQVDDFKWLKAEHSPNWCILPQEERLSDDIWEKVVPGGPGVGVEDILKRIGLTE